MLNLITRQSETLYSLQVLRGIASLLVLLEHVFKEVHSRVGLNLDVFHFPWAVGIDLFFVISGLIMYYTNAQNFGSVSSVPQFIKRRIIRVVPLYYIFTTLAVLVVVFAPSLMGKTVLDWAQIVSSYLFFPYERHDGRISPVLSLGWTLNYEMYFYLIFAGILWLPRQIALPVFAMTIIGLVLLGYVFEPSSAALRFMTSDLLLEFLFGVAIGVMARHNRSLATNWSNVTVGIGISVTVLWLGSVFGVEDYVAGAICQGLPCALIVYVSTVLLAAESERNMPRVGIVLGDISYALYLCHRFVLPPIVLVVVFVLGKSMVSAVLAFTAAMILCPLAAYVVYRWIEIPLLAFLNSLLRPRAKVATGVHV